MEIGKHYKSRLSLSPVRASLPAYHCFHAWQVAATRKYRVFPLYHAACLPVEGEWSKGDVHLCIIRLHPGSHLIPLVFHWNAFPCPLVNYCEEIKKSLENCPFENLGSPPLSRRQRSEERVPEPSSIIDAPKPKSNRSSSYPHREPCRSLT